MNVWNVREKEYECRECEERVVVKERFQDALLQIKKKSPTISFFCCIK